jgi:allophanate hydrolase subunit 2
MEKFSVVFRYDGPVTSVSVRLRDGDEEMEFLGVVSCHVLDQYDRVKGRKLALRDALEVLPKETRAEIWKQIFTPQSEGGHGLRYE